MRTQNSRCSSPIRVFTINRLAERLAVDRRTLKRALGDTKPTKHGRFKAYTLADARAALAAHRDRMDPLEKLRVELLAKRVEMLDQKLARLRSDFIRRDRVLEFFTTLDRRARAVFEQKLLVEYPLQAAGREPAELRKLGKAVVDEICVAMQGLMADCKKPAVAPEKEGGQ